MTIKGDTHIWWLSYNTVQLKFSLFIVFNLVFKNGRNRENAAYAVDMAHMGHSYYAVHFHVPS